MAASSCPDASRPSALCSCRRTTQSPGYRVHNTGVYLHTSSSFPCPCGALSLLFLPAILFSSSVCPLLGSPPPHPDSLFTFLIDLDYHAELQVLCMWDSWSHHLPGSWAHISLYTSQMPPMPQPQEGLPLPPSAAPFPTPDSLCSLISSLELQGT